MSKQILVESRGGQREIALMEDGRLLAYFAEAPGKIEAEQIYLAAADRMVKGMEACFVRLGGEQTGFLPFSECKEKPRSGDRFLVQVKKPPVGDKAPYLTQDISLAGRYAILTPLSDRCAVSKRITDESEKQRLLSLAERLRPTGCGVVMRLESADADESAVRAEIDELWEQWETIRARADRMSAPGLAEGRPDALRRLLRDEHGKVDRILTNDPASIPDAPVPAEQCENPFDLFSVRAKMEKSLHRKVWLDSGGFLIIDKTEAMTVVDVNSGKFTGLKSGAESTFLKLNLEAAGEIARLMRLRNMGGIIIVDFVDMQSDESRRAVLEKMQAELARDPVKTVVHGFTSLGLMELTRKKTEESL